MNNMKHKILMTLALLITAVGGAWADYTVTWEGTTLQGIAVQNNTATTSQTVEGITVTASNGKFFYDTNNPKGPVVQASSYADNGLVFSAENNIKSIAITFTEAASYGGSPTFEAGAYTYQVSPAAKSFALPKNDSFTGITKVVFTLEGDAPVAGPEVSGPTIVEGKPQWTFTMPAYDVEIAPIYAPAAKWATEGNLVLTPTAIEGIIAGTEDAIVKAGTVAKIGETENPQGIVMYAVTSTNEATAPALTAFSADVPTAKNITIGSEVLVWYYIKGADTPQGETATAENTFNDSEICTTPIKVEVLSNKFDIQFNAANANTIESGKATVKVGDAAAEVKEGKLTGVKMGSKVTITAKDGYKFRKAEGKKTGPAIWDGDLAKLTNESTEEFATATDGMTITGTLTANVKVSIADGATITFDNATINGVNNESYKWAGITCLGDATIILKDGTTNKVKGFFKRYPGIQPGPSGKTLIIKGGTAGTGTLEASSSQWGPGIGGENATCGNIEIQGGVITAKGDNGAAGIGSGHARCGNITISGGTVKATGGSYGAGIGSGNGNGETQICGDIVISGGTIEATGGSESAGIGSGSGGVCGTVTITSGVTSVKATKGNDAPNSIGRGYSGKCGTVTIGGVEGAISTSPYTYQPGN